MNQQNKSFSHYPFETGFLALCDTQYLSYLHAWEGAGSYLKLEDKGTHFVFCDQGPASLVISGFAAFTLYEGMYAAVPQDCIIAGGRGIAITRVGYLGVFMLGGPVEEKGRLRYIDGCTDSLLIPPVKMGDPCFNLLHFPPGIDQTMHTHPSARVGLVHSGRGVCVTPDEEIPLVPGTIFCIHTDGPHKFRTDDTFMNVLAYHPDSDFGPTDEIHPMKTRTIVNGVSASKLPELWTK